MRELQGLKRRYAVARAMALVGSLGALALAVRAQTQAIPRPVPPHLIDPGFIPPPRPWPRPMPVPVLNQELQLQSQAARVEISGGVARTRLVQTFRNTTNRTIEGTYMFPLPQGAAVSGFAMTVNGKRTEAEILEGDKARQIYTGIVQKMRDPAILEFIDRNLIRARIFPIAAGGEPRVELEYSESLRADNGSFRYVIPLRLPEGGTAHSASVDIHIQATSGIRAVYSPTHEVEIKRDGNSAHITGEFGAMGTTGAHEIDLPRDGLTRQPDGRDDTRPGSATGSDRDFVLYYSADNSRVGVNLITHHSGDEDGYFMLLVAPDPTLSPQEIAAKDVVFVVDTSGSMAGEKIEQARHALLTLLGNLNPRDRFNIVTFASDVRTFHDDVTPVSPATVAAAREFVRDIKAVGGTNINDALLESLKMLQDRSRPQQMVFMTDGQPTVGETDVAQILKNVRAANSRRPARATTSELNASEAQAGDGHGGEAPLGDSRARLFVFGVGLDVNTRLLDTLAEDNRGSSDYVLPEEDIEQKVGSLYSKIAYPVLADPRLDWGGMKVYDVYPKRLPDLFRGMQTVVFGRYAGTGAARVQLIGTAQNREQRIAGQGSFADEGRLNDMLPRLWAMRKVGYLLDDARRSDRPIADEVRDEIVKLSKRYGIVTPYTAGLITEDNQPVPPNQTIIDRPMLNGGSFDRRTYGGPVRQGQGRARGMGRASAADSAGNSFGGFGGGARDEAGPQGPAGAMAPPPPRIGAAMPSSGAGAVAASKSTNELRKADKDTGRQSRDVRYLEGKAFFLKAGAWTDSAFDAAKSPRLVTVKFASPEYFELLKDPRVAKWLSLGDRVVVVLPDRTIKIEP